MKINKRIFKIVALVLIQVLVMLDCAGFGGFCFDLTYARDTNTLSPRICMQAAILLKAFQVKTDDVSSKAGNLIKADSIAERRNNLYGLLKSWFDHTGSENTKEIPVQDFFDWLEVKKFKLDEQGQIENKIGKDLKDLSAREVLPYFEEYLNNLMEIETLAKMRIDPNKISALDIFNIIVKIEKAKKEILYRWGIFSINYNTLRAKGDDQEIGANLELYLLSLEGDDQEKGLDLEINLPNLEDAIKQNSEIGVLFKMSMAVYYQPLMEIEDGFKKALKAKLSENSDSISETLKYLHKNEVKLPEEEINLLFDLDYKEIERTINWFELTGSYGSEQFNYEPLEYELVRELANVLDLRSDDIFYDLGCGYGTVLFYLALVTKLKRAKGFDIVKERVKEANRIKQLLKLRNVEILHGNLKDEDTDFSDGTVFFMFDPFGEDTLKAVLEKLKQIAMKKKVKIIAWKNPDKDYFFDSQRDWLKPIDDERLKRGRLADLKFFESIIHPQTRNQSSKKPEVFEMVSESKTNLFPELMLTKNIKDKKLIKYISSLFDSTEINNEVKERIARLIIEEVTLNDKESVQLRLRALKTIIPSVISRIKYNRPSEGQIDLHTHTYLSDAYATPTAWILQAYEKEGLTAMAITDHDIFPGQEAFEAVKILNYEISKQNNMDNGTRPHFSLIPGMEITTLQDGVEVHVLLYIPNYYNDDFKLEEKREVRNILLKFRDGEAETPERIENIRQRLNKQYPYFSISQENINKIVRGPDIYVSAVGDALWEKYKDVYPEEFERLEISSAKYVWYNLIAKKGLSKRSKEYEKLLPTVEDVLELAGKLKGRIAIAHPNEIIVQKEGAFEEILERLARYVVDKNISPSIILGIAYYSHKLRRSGLRDKVKDYVDLLNEHHPFFKKFNLLFIPESDAHGKFTLSSDPLLSSPLGLQSDYPEDKADYNEELLTAIYDKSFLPLSSNELSQIQQEYEKWGCRRIEKLRKDAPNPGRGIDNSIPCEKVFLSKEAVNFITHAI